jgi:hypothetical protein
LTSILNRQGEAAEDDDGFHDNEAEDRVTVIEGGAKGKTATKKRGRARRGKEVDPAKLFGDGGPLHALTRRAVPIWNSSASAVEVGESVHHTARLNGAKLAAEAWNINGMRAKASEVMTGEFLRQSLYGVAQHADKVRLQA